VRDGRLRTNIGNVSTLDDAIAALNPTERREGKRSSAFIMVAPSVLLVVFLLDTNDDHRTIPVK
jgi:hypothetical protein